MVAEREGVQSSFEKDSGCKTKQDGLHQTLVKGRAVVFLWSLYIKHKAKKQVDPFQTPLHLLYPSSPPPPTPLFLILRPHLQFPASVVDDE